jgi:hypothetical protein
MQVLFIMGIIRTTIGHSKLMANIFKIFSINNQSLKYSKCLLLFDINIF